MSLGRANAPVPAAALSPRRRWQILVALVTIVVVVGFVLPVVPAGRGAGDRATAPLAPSGELPALAPHRVPSAPSAAPVHVATAARSASAFHGPHPAAWGPSGTPPGAEALQRALASSPSPAADSGTQWNNRFCAGLWPWSTSDQSGQSYYASGCYGHDEPGLQFYSNLPGSGGNITWNFTLPTDRSATENQSNLYSAIWFGMTLVDPLAWMHQCFLELQFYPDDLFTNPDPIHPNWTVNGQWIGAAVAWQIETATVNETP
ncbi:MAG: hypothetical protein L3J73_00585, partial [Thermoplasmata archaeon]|nr:hypothetical protein [Thermoplasmata archaeon]